ncbi:ubiquinone biosynthesis protein COQ9, mitochondrial-like isoform X2 [Aricia agestis]|uniref:ubiquinone biosynthesis protein COQ9, mitochondrial-like isoform X2 n=1 Tax=Aricia agestis TaxID=91739 RepID=UPI001C20A3FA|nr:ubiquinone biosynthesis protein COQ9, mitochondrial-like isoform X2 [Aricia agestis]
MNHMPKIIYSMRNGRKALMSIAYIQSCKALQLTRAYCKETIKNEIPNDSSITVNTEHDERQYEEDIKRRILTKAMEFVPTSGWSVESLTQGSEAIGYPGITHGLFPNGGGDLVHYFNVTCNEQLVQHMKNWPKEELKEPNIPVKLIEDAIVTRILMIDPYKNTWPKAMAIQALPNNVPNSLATLLSLVDDICYHTGDRSVDFNWYLRRVGLAGIYKVSELFYLTDNSPGSSGTKNFVKARIRDAEFIQIAIKMNPIAAAPQTLTAAFTTAKNILGINTLK